MLEQARLLRKFRNYRSVKFYSTSPWCTSMFHTSPRRQHPTRNRQPKKLSLRSQIKQLLGGPETSKSSQKLGPLEAESEKSNVEHFVGHH